MLWWIAFFLRLFNRGWGAFRSRGIISCVPGHRARRVGGLSSGDMQGMPNEITGRGTNRQETGLELSGTDCQATRRGTTVRRQGAGQIVRLQAVSQEGVAARGSFPKCFRRGPSILGPNYPTFRRAEGRNGFGEWFAKSFPSFRPSAGLLR